MKKLYVYLTIAVIWVLGVILFLNIGNLENAEGEFEFTVLAVKEDLVKDYNTMPVFQKIAEETGHDVHYIYNTSMQYNNNPDPVGISGIDAIYHAGFSNLQLYNYGKRKRIVAIDEYLEYMPNFAKILKERPDIKEALTSPDGHIYSLPRVEEMGLVSHPNILFINKKLLTQLIDEGKMPINLTKEQ